MSLPHVLIADDEIMLRVMAAEALEEAGFRVSQAANGHEALAALRANPEIGLLISDIRMPGMDGCALARAALMLKPELKILLVTGYAAELDGQTIRDGGLEVLRKPFNLQALCRRARELTGRPMAALIDVPRLYGQAAKPAQ